MRAIAILLLVLMVTSPAGSRGGPKAPYGEKVSMIQLIANPEKYDGKLIAVVGYLQLKFEDNELFLHEEDYKHYITKNAIWVSVGPKMKPYSDQLNMHYVLLVGTFNATNKGHMDMESGSILAEVGRLWGSEKTPTEGTQ
jgi:hypothetical protein